MSTITIKLHQYRALLSALALAGFLAAAVSVQAQSDLLPPPPPPPPPPMTGSFEDTRPSEPVPVTQPATDLPPPPPPPPPPMTGVADPAPRPAPTPAPRPAPVPTQPAERPLTETVRPTTSQDEVGTLRDPSPALLERMRQARAAQTETLTQLQADQQARRAALVEAQAEARERRAQAMDEIGERRALLQEQAQAHLERAFNRYVERARAAISRLSTLADRLEERTRIIEEETGERLTIAREGVDEARRLLIQAGEDVEIASMAAREVFASDQPRERFSEIREAIAIVRETLREAHLALRGALAAIQSARSEQ